MKIVNIGPGGAIVIMNEDDIKALSMTEKDIAVQNKRFRDAVSNFILPILSARGYLEPAENKTCMNFFIGVKHNTDSEEIKNVCLCILQRDERIGDPFPELLGIIAGLAEESVDGEEIPGSEIFPVISSMKAFMKHVIEEGRDAIDNMPELSDVEDPGFEEDEDTDEDMFPNDEYEDNEPETDARTPVYLVSIFSSMDKVINAAKELKVSDDDKSSLYRYNDDYYLLIRHADDNMKEMVRNLQFLREINDGDSSAFTEKEIVFYREHFLTDPIIKDDAVKQLQEF